MDTNLKLIGFIIGFISLFLWLLPLIPQLVQNYRTKRCDGLSIYFLFFWWVLHDTESLRCDTTWWKQRACKVCSWTKIESSPGDVSGSRLIANIRGSCWTGTESQTMTIFLEQRIRIRGVSGRGRRTRSRCPRMSPHTSIYNTRKNCTEDKGNVFCETGGKFSKRETFSTGLLI